MATTQIKAFTTNAAGSGGNRLSPTDYAALTTLLAGGFQAGTALSVQVNTVLAQTSFMAAGLAGWIVSQGISVPDDGNLTNLVSEIDGAIAAKIASTVSGDVGFTKAFAGTSAPAGYLACNGAAVSRTTYAALFAAIGTTWGVGDGTTTFNIPNTQRRTLVGSGGSGTGTLGNAVGNTGGEEAHTLITAEMPAHVHPITSGFASANDGGSGGPTRATPGNGSTDSTGGDGAHNNMQPSAVMLMCIKYT